MQNIAMDLRWRDLFSSVLFCLVEGVVNILVSLLLVPLHLFWYIHRLVKC